MSGFSDADEAAFAKLKENEGHYIEIRDDPLLNERQSTHGLFSTNALISQRLKEQMHRHSPSYNELSDVHKEALEMICLKASRILSGQAKFKDHWDDIAGYAKLGAEACE